jgi:hypothetical protein
MSNDKRFMMTFTPYPHAFIRVIKPLLSSCAGSIACLFIEEYYGYDDMKNDKPIEMPYSYIIENTGFSDQTSIAKALKELEKFKLISISSGHKKMSASQYMLIYDTLKMADRFMIETKRDYKLARQYFNQWIETGIIPDIDVVDSITAISGNQSVYSGNQSDKYSGNQSIDTLETRESYIKKEISKKTTTENKAESGGLGINTQIAQLQCAIQKKYSGVFTSVSACRVLIQNHLDKGGLEYVLSRLEAMPLELKGTPINVLNSYCINREWGAKKEEKTVSVSRREKDFKNAVYQWGLITDEDVGAKLVILRYIKKVYAEYGKEFGDFLGLQEERFNVILNDTEKAVCDG